MDLHPYAGLRPQCRVSAGHSLSISPIHCDIRTVPGLVSGAGHASRRCYGHDNHGLSFSMLPLSGLGRFLLGAKDARLRGTASGGSCCRAQGGARIHAHSPPSAILVPAVPLGAVGTANVLTHTGGNDAWGRLKPWIGHGHVDFGLRTGGSVGRAAGLGSNIGLRQASDDGARSDRQSGKEGSGKEGNSASERMSNLRDGRRSERGAPRGDRGRRGRRGRGRGAGGGGVYSVVDKLVQAIVTVRW